MNHPHQLTRALVRLVGATLVTGALVAGPLAAGAGSAYAAPHPRLDEVDPVVTPLTVAMTSMTPSVIPRRGVITISGVVTNASEEEWTDINVAPFIAGEPITTRDALAEAAASPADTAIGQRLTDPGTYVSIDALSPGETAPFTVRIPRSSLLISGDPGVYWIGVHALGSSPEGRDLVADGRARTFIPLVTPVHARERETSVSVVLPVRERARRAPDGSLNGPLRWAGLTGPTGRLTRLADFAASAGTTPLTWLIDPAVLDALDDYSRGNPPLSLEPVTGSKAGQDDGGTKEDGQGDDQSGSSPSPSPLPTVTGPGTPSTRERAGARSVLETFVQKARTAPVLTLGYGDPDVVALARRRAGLITRADTLSSRRMTARGLAGSPTVAPPDGYFDPALLPEVPAGSLVVLSDDGRLQEPPLSRLTSGQELLLTDARSIGGGSDPATALDPLALRQRILAEAALEVEKGDAPTRPIIVGLPSRWDPGPRWRQADFFGGLQQPWVRLGAAPRGATTTFEGALPYGRDQLDEEIRIPNVLATRTLNHTSAILGDLLTDDTVITDQLAGAAFQASAYSARRDRRMAADLVLELDASTREQMGAVQVTGTDFVTLSGGSGSLTVTLVNGLDQPIDVGLSARTDGSGVRVETPDPVSMQPGQRTTVRLQVRSDVGVHRVTLYPVTTQGQVAGTPLTFSLRTSQVGRLIWYILIAAGALLAVMIVRRIVLRIRHHRWRVEDPT